MGWSTNLSLPKPLSGKLKLERTVECFSILQKHYRELRKERIWKIMRMMTDAGFNSLYSSFVVVLPGCKMFNFCSR